MKSSCDNPTAELAHNAPMLTSAEGVDPLMALLGSAVDAVIVVDAAGHCIAANQAAENLLEYERDECLTLGMSDIVVGMPGGSDLAGRQNSGPAQARRKDGSLATVEVWSAVFLGPAGTVSLVYLRSMANCSDTGKGVATDTDGAAVRASNGDVGSATVVVRDVTHCLGSDQELREARATAKDTNRALRESEERFRGAFDGASIGMALVSPEGRIMLANPALREILGYSGNALRTKSFQDVTHPDDLDSDRELARQLLAGEIETYQIEKRYLRKDGEFIWGRLTVSLMRDGVRTPRYLVAQIQDITPYKAAGAALREAEARYRTLVEQIPAAVYVDEGGSLGTPRYVSPRIQALLGYSPREWVTDPELWMRTIHPADRDRIVAAVAHANGTDESMHLEYRFLARDGREVWVHDQVALVRDEDGVGQYWQGFMVDITDRKRAEEELRLAKEAAEEANRLKSAFLSMATHELRTPLTIISGYVEMLAESSMAHLSPEEREFLDIAQTGVRTLAALVDDLLDLARMEAGRLELLIHPVDVMEAIERVQRLVAAQAASKGIALKVFLAPGLPPVAADLNRLVQVLFNLLGNAIKFTERGSVLTTVHSVDGAIEFRVVDTGVGIAPDALHFIFDEFRQADIGTTRKFGGSGLGLAIAKRLVDMQGGTISVASVVGEGSTFTVSLPAVHSGSAWNARGRHEGHSEQPV